eukprot:2824748-Alexandrium_andersonii.AAC.1
MPRTPQVTHTLHEDEHNRVKTLARRESESTLDGPVRSTLLVDDTAYPGPKLAQVPSWDWSGRAP